MINIKNLSDKDIGKAVVYTAHDGAEPEQGKITSYNDTYIFVRYDVSSSWGGQATRPEDLKWL